MRPLFLVFLLLPISLFSQQESESQSQDSILWDAPKVFVDCFYCDVEYVKQNVPFLNYVRDRKVADVHVLGLRQSTGAGGWEESFEFIGQDRFAQMTDTIQVIIGPNDSSDEKRRAETCVFKIGMMRYVARTSISQNMNIDFTESVDQTNVEDPWNNWVFEIGGNGWVNGSDVNTTMSFWSNLNAEKVTPEFRFRFNFGADYMETRQVLSDEVFASVLRGQDLNTEAIWSISDHWSWGVFGHSRTSIFNNYSLTYHVRPGIEYNVFPYSVSSKKQLRISYRIGAGQNWYNETTVFAKDQEFIPRHGMSLSYRIREKWGNINVGLWSNQYLHNTQLYSARAWVNVNLRIAKGFNFNLNGNYGVTQDQISLSAVGLTDEEILAGQGQRATNYTYNGSIGLSYTFGSIYNSVVNPRFD